MKYKVAAVTRKRSHSRTPQGVRGLKWKVTVVVCLRLSVAPRKGCVD